MIHICAYTCVRTPGKSGIDMPFCPQCAINVSLRSKLSLLFENYMNCLQHITGCSFYCTVLLRMFVQDQDLGGRLKVHLFVLFGKLNSQLVLIAISRSCLQPAATVRKHKQSFCILLHSLSKSKEREIKMKLGLLAQAPKEV